MKRIDVLVIGNGGREHALVAMCKKSPRVKKVFVAPGNPGMGKLATLVDIHSTDINALAAFAQKNQIGLTVVGPEAPLEAGIADLFRHKGLLICGPTAYQARLELSKAFAAKLLKKYDIPIPSSKVCTTPEAAIKAVRCAQYPLVVKPDGNTGGHGVKICKTVEQAIAHINAVMVDHIYASKGDSGNCIVLQEYLEGPEISITLLTDGKKYILLPDARDYKQRYDDDVGPMTGSMGSVSPSPVMTETLRSQIELDIVQPLLVAVREHCNGNAYCGVLYLALMITNQGPKVLEVNVRFGDSEAQAILPRIQSDLVPVLLQIANGRLEANALEIDPRHAACVNLVSRKYPAPDLMREQAITGIEDAETVAGVTVYHAGTKSNEQGQLIADGGRVLNVIGFGQTLQQATQQAYSGTAHIQFDDKSMRTDIGECS